jgi:hypothetical protein
VRSSLVKSAFKLHAMLRLPRMVRILMSPIPCGAFWPHPEWYLEDVDEPWAAGGGGEGERDAQGRQVHTPVGRQVRHHATAHTPVNGEGDDDGDDDDDNDAAADAAADAADDIDRKDPTTRS